MNPGKISAADLADDGVTWTMLATLYLRAWESRSPQSILRDVHAAAALDRIDYDFAALKRRLSPRSNQYLVALRAKQFDDWCTDFLRHNPDATVVQLGCGLDSRMLRLDLPDTAEWIDLDQPWVIDLRRKLYPDHEHCHTIAASVTDPGWLDELPADRPVLFLAEGLLPYLAPDEVRALLPRLAQRCTGELMFDTFTPWAIKLISTFKWGLRDGAEVQRWDPRLRLLEQVPYTRNWRSIPPGAMRTVYRTMDWIPLLRGVYHEFRYAIG